jgi:ABC-2 type transport system permease protein
VSAVLASNTARLAAITRRDWCTAKRYQFRQLLQLLDFVYAAILAFYVGQLFETVPEELAQFGGSYFDFAMVGLAVMSVAGLGIGAFNETITREQTLGTLEVLLVTPTPVPVLLAGSLVLPLGFTFLDVALYIGIGIGVFGNGLTVSGVVLAFPLFVFTLASFCAFGIVGASIAVLAKRGDPVSGVLVQVTSVLSGALFPVSVFPPVLELLARCFPAYYGINGLREALLGGAGWTEVAPDLAVLIGFVVILLPLSVWIFGRALAASRRAGILGNY